MVEVIRHVGVFSLAMLLVACLPEKINPANGKEDAGHDQTVGVDTMNDRGEGIDVVDTEVLCSPQCDGKHCGDDGCGGDCGECLPAQICTSGKCTAPLSCVGSCTQTDPSDSCACSQGCQIEGNCCDDFCEACTDLCLYTQECGEISEVGCCDGTLVRYCEGGGLVTLDCSAKPTCGWDTSAKVYDCSTDGEEEPTDLYPMQCPDE